MKAINYWDYIKVEQLLALQGGFDNDERGINNEEVLFISVHQIYELWFKLILRELSSSRNILAAHSSNSPEIVLAVRSLKRAISVFGQANQHFQLMETMTARDFLEFRERLAPASGFQSAQLREIEILLGLEDTQRISIGNGCSYRDALKLPGGAPSSSAQRVEARAADGPSFKHCLYDWLSRVPIDGSNAPADITRFLEAYLASLRAENDRRLKLASSGLAAAEIEQLRARYAAEDAGAQAFLLAEDDPQASDAERETRRAGRAAMLFIESYRELPQLAWPHALLESVLELEQAMLIWRQRHARMVERFIGRRIGTGGSSGVDYLDQTARYRIFTELWTVRSLLLRKAAVPQIRSSAGYGFVMEGFA
ncbi:tryptophan 2,3-dioxygenase [Xanthomonas campestris]|uniref:tryptophan 2,3-dioxygenase family protein n=1 Tax=Xanthomonas campestris TaxID=339 RepID=UPI000E325716|nr:tryptophan 2,3-dioxygenase family protein [Xanthomonas campestris]MCC5074277.1 tryptophan 2,3-dioxygenase family protein [Xanthomonas campestris pv. plantaginis]MEA9491671.1 tryptophan 2,3-dioxygenase family protein [Xanthomonas campestris]MEA9510275.1 tryptophan 2,3-dioxygenase family protein [Xanthomonas campestris]MEA9577218.1 tryptophan 2,3-dioxygenase family protein [Xanthomonas campestris]MEA9607372.1 tryptophan 2,3-dioxygenase family protein [Xanthomonas campestris pv. plantaginis]